MTYFWLLLPDSEGHLSSRPLRLGLGGGEGGGSGGEKGEGVGGGAWGGGGKVKGMWVNGSGLLGRVPPP